MNSDEKFMNRCIELARIGKGQVAPNPLVGAVIVHEGKIIGEGYHQKYGEAHAEVNAVNAVLNKDLLKESTIYVSLEPCAHHGKTPPCADLLVQSKFKRVVIGCTDTFDQVSGKGVEKLKTAGIEVEIGVLEKECRKLNKHFFTFHEKKRPFVFLKWAQTSNGKIDSNENKASNSNPIRTISWISVPEVQTLVHQWRADYMSILVGRKTVENDNPSLTVRAVTGNNPIRIVIDSMNSLSDDYSIFNDEAQTIVITQQVQNTTNKKLIAVDKISAQSILDALYKNDIQSVMIEGGASTLQSFIDSGLWDEACVIQGQNDFESGTNAPTITGKFTTQLFFGDTLKFYTNG